MAAARRRQQRKRMAIWTGTAIVGVLAVVFLISAATGGDEETAESTNTSSTLAPATTVAASSAAGKPCVAVADPLPAGAPAVPVDVGPPPTQLVTRDLRPGTGPDVQRNATVKVNYIGVACSTGKIFDSSYKGGTPTPIEFPLSGVIKGWTDGIPGMKVGGQRLLGIPADQAYGSTGRPPNILPDEPLWFVVEVLEAR
jgi:peptidylprolyl isomerase